MKLHAFWSCLIIGNIWSAAGRIEIAAVFVVVAIIILMVKE